jgi:hypothetical protein
MLMGGWDTLYDGISAPKPNDVKHIDNSAGQDDGIVACGTARTEP